MTRLEEQFYRDCTLCPRRCHANRTVKSGFCGAGIMPMLARAALHHWEEPVLSAASGSGAVFFSNCTLKCIFCQNYSISTEGFGREVSAEALADTFLRLEEQGAQNVDLITATHYLPTVLQALELVKHRLTVPVVYNCGGYEAVDTLRMLEGLVDIWLPDIKYYDNELAMRLSAAPDYFETAIAAVKEMLRQAGAPVLEEVQETNADRNPDSGLNAGSERPPVMKRGVIIRHMVLPKHRSDSIALLNAVAERLGTGGYLISVLSQYTPFYKAVSDPSFQDLNRRITSFEYDSVVKEALRLGFDGFMQEKSSAKEEYTPSFDLEGVPES